MNPIGFIQRKFAPVVEAARAEIEHLRVFIEDNEREIHQLREQNIQLQGNLAENQRALAERIVQVNEARRLLGLDEPNPDDRLEDVARRLLDNLARSNQRIVQLEHQIHEAKASQERLIKKLKIIGWSTGGLVGTCAVGYGAYKVAKVFAAVQAGAVAGGGVGAAVGAPGGPLLLGTGAVGSVIGGLAGGIVAIVTP
jgi:uncharacterized protein YhaN